jgi:hypothetical protein
MSFGIYSSGAVGLVGGLVYGAALLGVPAHWIVACAFAVSGTVLAGAAVPRRNGS